MAQDSHIQWFGPDARGIREGRFRDDTGPHKIEITVPGLAGHEKANLSIDGRHNLQRRKPPVRGAGSQEVF